MQWCTYVEYPKWRTESRSSLLIRVNGSYNVVEQLTNSTDPRFVRLCGEQFDTLLNKDVSKRLKVSRSLARVII